MISRWYYPLGGSTVSRVPASKPYRRVIAASLRTTREARDLSREAVIFRLTELGNPVSVSTLARWEQYGTLKAEDAWYLSEVYKTTLDELLMSLPFPQTAKELAADADLAVQAAEEAARAAEALDDDAAGGDEPPQDEDEPQPGQSG